MEVEVSTPAVVAPQTPITGMKLHNVPATPDVAPQAVRLEASTPEDAPLVGGTTEVTASEVVRSQAPDQSCVSVHQISSSKVGIDCKAGQGAGDIRALATLDKGTRGYSWVLVGTPGY